MKHVVIKKCFIGGSIRHPEEIVDYNGPACSALEPLDEEPGIAREVPLSRSSQEQDKPVRRERKLTNTSDIDVI